MTDGHGRSPASSIANFGSYALSPSRRQLLREGAAVHLGTRAMDLLIALVENAGNVLTHRQLLERAWPGLTVEEANLRVHISVLRKTLGEEGGRGQYIENLVGRGYCFVAPVTWTEVVDAPAHPPPAGVSPSSPRLRQRLPMPPARIIGMGDLVPSLVAELDRHRFVTLVGAGGIGKTTTAVLVSEAVRSERDSDLIFLDLSPVRDPALLASALASMLGVVSKPGHTEDAIVAHLQGASALLILDSCEHLVDAAATLGERLFVELPELQILATSRESLRASGEHVHILQPLATPMEGAGLTAAEALSYPAVQLFMDRAATSGHRAPLEDAQATLVGDICRRLDGVALAIELVASRAGTFGLEGVADMMRESFHLHGQGRRSAPARHQTLEALFDWSYALLTPRDQKVLQRLAMFTGFFTLKDALVVATDEEDDRLSVANSVTGLVDKSLVWTSASGSPVQFRLLDTTRAFAARKLVESGDGDRVARRHLRHVMNILKEDKLDSAIFSGRDLSAHASHLGDVRAALHWARDNPHETEDFVHLAAVAAPLFLGLSLLGECEHWCRLGLDAIGPQTEGRHAQLLLLEGLAIGAMFTQGDRDTISAAIRDGQALAARLGEVSHELHLLAGEHIFITRLGNFAGALRVAERCAALAARVDEPDVLAMADWMMGCCHHLLGDQLKGQSLTERGFEHLAVADAPNVDYFGFDHRVRALEVLARVAWLRGDVVGAAQFAEDVVQEADRRGHPVSVCIALIYATTVALWSEDADLADQHIARLLAHADRHALPPYRVVGEGLMGQLAIQRGDLAEGVSAIERALAYCHIEGHQVLSTEMMASLARGQAALGQVQDARATIETALEQARLAGGACNLAELTLVGAELEMGAGSATDVVDRLIQETLRTARAQSSHHLELKAALLNHRLHGREDTKTLLAECAARVSPECAARYGLSSDGPLDGHS